MTTTSLNGDEPHPKRRRLSTDILNNGNGDVQPGLPHENANEAEAGPVNGTSSIPAAPASNGHLGPQYRLKATLMGHTRGLSAVKISPDGKWIVTASADGRLLLYSLSDLAFHRALEHNTAGYGGINDVVWSPDSESLASASDDKTVKIFHLQSGNLTRIFHGHTAYVFCLAYNPQGTLMVSGSFDETLKLWDVGSGTCLNTIAAHSDPITAVDINKDGTMIASSSHDGLVRIWDCQTGQCIKSLSDDSNPPVSNVRFTPNGKFILACSLDSIIRLWSPFTEKAIKTYSGHTNAKFDVTPSFVTNVSSESGQTFVACGSEDGRIFLWDVQSRQVTASWQAHMDAVIGVAAHGTYIVSAGLEKDLVAKVWVNVAR